MYSNDFRKLSLKLYKEYGSYRKVCKILNIGIATLSRWRNLKFKKKRVSFYNKVSNIKNIIQDYIIKNPFITINDIKNYLILKNINVSNKTISKAIKLIGFSKKKAFHKVNKKNITKEEIQELKSLFDKDEIYSLDECYFSEKVLPSYGYSKKGERLNTLLKPKSWKKRSLLMAVSNKGNCISEIYNGSINSIIFNKFITENLSNKFILMDNVSFHKTIKNNKFFFIPPYSPEYNPVEYCFSKIKNYFRKNIMNNKNIDYLINMSINNLNICDIINSFNHCKKLLIKGI